MTDVENPPNGWEQHAAALADTIPSALPGVDQAWIDAVTHAPRHLLVPLFHQQHHGEWATVGAGDDGFLTEVYRDAPLITALLPNGVGGYEVVSSSTKPALMVRMLDALSIHPGHRVLEIGTGTGYNAALLCHRLGQHAVSSVDIGAGLVELARDRLARIGYRPDLCVTDGRAGRPDCGPYDRIIATCSVPAIPWDWYEQLVEDGAVLVDLKIGLHAATSCCCAAAVTGSRDPSCRSGPGS
ncbi:MAG: methyltransferase domain-containing protein [Actinomycetota bacterium]|nr:methyltransferase domain-containing protein [Actinomycetota bacterium]